MAQRGWVVTCIASLLACSAAACATQVAVGLDDWPQWRGPSRDATTRQSVTLWPPVKLWEANVGSGVSSVIAAQGRVYAMGHRAGQDTVWCLDARSGTVLWTHSYAAKGDHTSDVSLPGPRSTPATDGQHVFTLSLEGNLRCLDADTGELLWSRLPAQLGVQLPQYGICCPILLHGDRLIVDLHRRCLAIDKLSGKPLWQAAGGEGWNGAAPVAATFGAREFIVYGHGRCVDAANGREFWSVGHGEMSVTTPIVHGDRVFLSPFHGRNYGGGPCVLLRVDGTRASVVWQSDEVQSLCSTAVLWKGLLFAPDRDDISLGGETGRRMNLKCIEFDTGRVRWVKRPLAWPSCIVADGKLIIQTLTGELILADASAAGWRDHGRVKVLSGLCWTTPALADGRLYCRSIRGDLVCLQFSGQPRREPLPLLPEKVEAPPATQVAHAPAGEGPDEAAVSTKRWPGFRGPQGSGYSAAKDLPQRWDGRSGQGIAWKAPVPLKGYSSPIVWSDRVFLTGADAGRREVYCFDPSTGILRWTGRVENVPGGAKAPPKVWREPSYAAPTPATDGENVYAIFANGDLACFDLNGRSVWARSLGLPLKAYGHASSPVLCGDLLLVQWDQGQADEGPSKLLAFDVETGQTLWEAARPVAASWGTPIVINSGSRRQIIAPGAPWVIAYDPVTGGELWRADCMAGGYWAAPSPVFAGGLVYCVTEGAVLAAIRPDGSGDISSTHGVWTVDEDLPSVCSPVTDGKLIWLLTSSGLLTAHDARTGTRVWQKDLGDGKREFAASPVLAGDRLLILDSEGVMYAFANGREMRELGRCSLGEPSPGASPAIVDGRLYLRGEKHLFCIGQPPANAAEPPK